jgi:hypothetical protein
VPFYIYFEESLGYLFRHRQRRPPTRPKNKKLITEPLRMTLLERLSAQHRKFKTMKTLIAALAITVSVLGASNAANAFDARTFWEDQAKIAR